jgi:hypothetical protein
MRLVNYKSLSETQGNLLLVYAIAGGHKTCTTIQTAPDPITLLTAEGRKIGTSIVAINRPELKMKVGVYEGFNDLIDTVYDTKKFEGTKTVILDSLTHLMLVHLSQEVLQENYSAKSEKEQEEIMKALTVQVKMSQEGYGALSGQMTRLMRGLQGLTMAGYDVVCTARMADRPKWNRSLSAAPALMGQEFAKSMDGFFDFIGMIEPWEAPEGIEMPKHGASTAETWNYYAPLISFNPNDDYLAKWTGAMPPKGIIKRKFNVRKIFAEANGNFE